MAIETGQARDSAQAAPRVPGQAALQRDPSGWVTGNEPIPRCSRSTRGCARGRPRADVATVIGSCIARNAMTRPAARKFYDRGMKKLTLAGLLAFGSLAFFGGCKQAENTVDCASICNR